MACSIETNVSFFQLVMSATASKKLEPPNSTKTMDQAYPTNKKLTLPDSMCRLLMLLAYLLWYILKPVERVRQDSFLENIIFLRWLRWRVPCAAAIKAVQAGPECGASHVKCSCVCVSGEGALLNIMIRMINKTVNINYCPFFYLHLSLLG